MNTPDVFWYLGFGFVLFGTGMFAAGFLICAGVGARWIRRCYKQGLDVIEYNLRECDNAEKFIRGLAESNRVEKWGSNRAANSNN